MRLVAIEVMEATGNATFDTLARITRHSSLPLEYCGNTHLSHESGHTIGSEEELIDSLTFSEHELTQARALVVTLFLAFESFFDELLKNAKAAHQV